MKTFWVPLLTIPSLLTGYVMEKTPEPETLQPTPEDFDYDLYNRNQRAVSVSAEFLYWTVDEGAVDYAVKMRSGAWGPTPSYAQGRMESACYDFDPGFRVTAGYYNAPKFWEIFGRFTWLHVDGDDSTSRPSDSTRFLTGTWPQIFTTPVQKATSTIDLHYTVYELLAARVFHPNPHLRLRLMGGLTAPVMDQDWKIRYFDATDQLTYIKNTWDYWGVGPRIGIGMDWYWFKHIYVTARTSFAAVVGRYKNSSFQDTSANPSGNDNVAVPVRDMTFRDTRSSINFSFVLGPSFQYAFCSSRWELFAGYEFTNWLNVQEVYRSTASAADQAKETWLNRGLLTLHGLTVRLTADF